MKMDNTIRLIASGAGIVVLAVWLILPVLTFSLIIPLFMINGIMLAININQIGILLLIFPILMIIAPLTGDQKISAGAGALNLVMCLAVLLFKNAIIIHGNLRWIFRTASVLISNIGSSTGTAVTEANIGDCIGFACDNFLNGGLGLWICMIITLIYIVGVLVFGQMNSSGKPPMNKSFTSQTKNAGQKIVSSSSKGFSHRT